jgi:hypothetical protein
LLSCFSSGARINESCPLDGTAKCLTTTGTKIHLHISSKRNCEGGQGLGCTKDQPCYPCDLDSVVAFQTSRCRMCTTDNDGNCNFIPEVGPYCFQSPGSK